MSEKQINHKIHYLGKLCKRGHEYLNTGMSLRYNASRECIKCTFIKNHKPKTTEQIKRNQIYQSKYRKKNRQISKLNSSIYRKKEDVKQKLAVYHKTHRMILSDYYIKLQLHNATGIKTEYITPQMIELKRELIIFNRLKKEVLDGLNSRGNKRTEANGQAG